MSISNSKTSYTVFTATIIVIANMIGTGVFTSLGFQAAGISSGWALIALWVLGGIIALLGAFCYAELGSLMTRSGGEYLYLSKLFHPAIGFTSGWISITVGFAAPAAAASMALSKYAVAATGVQVNPNSIFNISSLIAVSVIIFLTLIHSGSRKISARFQNISTVAKVFIIVILIILGFIFGGEGKSAFYFDARVLKDIFNPVFAISIFFVLYSYSGWNAAAYIAGEINNPQKNLPRSLILGTSVVTILYILLNLVFIYAVPTSVLAGQLEIGYLFAGIIGGSQFGSIMGMVIAAILISSVSSLIIAGPRVTQAMGEDYKIFGYFKKTNTSGIPQRTIFLQGAISILYILTASFDQMITFIGFTLNLFTFMAVLGLFISRIKDPDAPRVFKVPFYPVVPALFLMLNIFILVYGLIYKPYESISGLGISAFGLLLYFVNKKLQK